MLRTNPLAPHLGGNIVGGDPNTYYPKLWQWLVSRYTISSVLDVGCGEGHALAEFQRLGCRTIGIDGLAENIAACPGKAIVHDIITGPYLLDEPVDLVWCCELVEHIEEKYLSNLLTTIAQGRCIAMTHAVVNQRGYHHVNCRDDAYWITALDTYGYSVLNTDTAYARQLFKINEKYDYWGQSGLIFVRR